MCRIRRRNEYYARPEKDKLQHRPPDIPYRQRRKAARVMEGHPVRVCDVRVHVCTCQDSDQQDSACVGQRAADY